MLYVTPSNIIQYLYCPRFVYFEHVLRIPQHEEKYYKVMKGREIHLRKARENMEYKRKRLGVKEKHINQYLTAPGLSGEVDEVLELNNGQMAPLDYKFARYEDKVYNTYKTQLYAYAALIEENFGKKVSEGYLVYTRSSNKLVHIEIAEADKARVKEAVEAIHTIIETNTFPRGTRYKSRCRLCTYRNICIQ